MQNFGKDQLFKVNTSNAVIINVKPGKPDPSNPQLRITQKGQKGYTCEFYALNWIRQRYGKYSKQQPQRRNEQLISFHRKKWSLLTEKIQFEQQLIIEIENLKSQYKDLKSHILKNQCLDYISNPKNLLSFNSLIDDFISVKRRDLIGKWKSKSQASKLLLLLESKNLSEFLKERHERLFSEYFNEECFCYGVDIRKFKPTYTTPIFHLQQDLQDKFTREGVVSKSEQDYIYNHYFDSLNQRSQSLLLNECASYKRKELYGLKTNTLDLSKNIDGLIELLKQYGPVTINGQIGRPYYPQALEKLKKINNEIFYAFPPHSYNSNSSEEGHVIVLVGASRQGYSNTNQDLVYYLDPTDESRPDQPAKIYVMSYANFKNRVQHTNSYLFEGDYIKISSTQYTYNPSFYEAQLKIANTETSIHHYGWFSCKKVTQVGLAAATAVTVAAVGIAYQYMSRS